MTWGVKRPAVSGDIAAAFQERGYSLAKSAFKEDKLETAETNESVAGSRRARIGNHKIKGIQVLGSNEEASCRSLNLKSGIMKFKTKAKLYSMGKMSLYLLQHPASAMRSLVIIYRPREVSSSSSAEEYRGRNLHKQNRVFDIQTLEIARQNDE
jgi:hypothetical protein